MADITRVSPELRAEGKLKRHKDMLDGTYAEVVASASHPVRNNGVLHRDSITAVDKITDFGADSVVLANVAGISGTLLANTAHYATVIPGNRWGNTKVSGTIETATTTADATDTHLLELTFSQATGADYYDIFLSTDAAPKWVARVTEAERLAGGRVITVGGSVLGDAAEDIATKIRTALDADPDVSAFFDAAGGTGTSVALTATTKAANDATMNISVADGTCDGITTDATSNNTTPGVAPVQQVETATATGTVTTSGNADVIVTAAGMTGSPKTINVAVVAGTQQVETATVVGTITGSGNASVTVTAADGGNLAAGKEVLVAVIAGTAQVEATPCVGTITTTGNGTFTVTADGMANSPKAVSVALVAGTQQVETATVVGTVTTTGNAAVTVTANDGGNLVAGKLVNVAVSQGVKQVETATIVEDVPGTLTAGNATVTVTSPLITPNPSIYSVALATNDTEAQVAAKFRTALIADSDITDNYTVTVDSANLIFTAVAEAANDATLNIAYANDTCAGLTNDASSTNTTAGVAPDDASAVATKIRAALDLDADVAAWFDAAGGAGAEVALTAATKAANDATMNIAIDNGTCAGLTAAPTSANTTAGVAIDTNNSIATKAAAAINLDADVSAYFTATVTGGNVLTLTRLAAAANDATMNIAYIDGTCVGLTTDATSDNTTAGVAPDDASSVASKIKTALDLDADVAAWFDAAGGAGANVALTVTTKAANDATLNIAIDNGTCAGLTAAPTSTNTTAGVAIDTDNSIASKIRAALSADGDVTAMFGVSGATNNIILTRSTAAANDATLNISIADGTSVGVDTAASSANTTAGNAGTNQVETAVIVGDITTSGNATVIVTAAGMSNSPKTVSVPVLATGTEGKIEVGIVGTGIQTSNAVFAQNNAYRPATVTAIDCIGYEKARILAKLTVTDLRSAPTLKLAPFFKNQISASDYHQGTVQTLSLLGGVGQSLEQDLTVTVDGSTGMSILIDTISGQGAAADVWVELV